MYPAAMISPDFERECQVYSLLHVALVLVFASAGIEAVVGPAVLRPFEASGELKQCGACPYKVEASRHDE